MRCCNRLLRSGISLIGELFVVETGVVAVVVSLLLSLAYVPKLSGQTQVNPAVSVPQENAVPTPRSSAEASEVNTAQARAAELVIASGDLLQISIFGTDFSCGPEKALGCQIRVSGTGEIVLPLIGPVRVAGLTVAQAEVLLASRFAEGFFNDPQVSVAQREYSNQGISVLGEVQKPGMYPLLGSHTLLDAISAAGGTTVKAGNAVSIFHRDRPNHPQHIDLSGPTGSSNVPVLPGDTIVVSKAGIVYVVGDVRQPSGIVMENSGLTVLQAIAMAQGANATASLDNAKLIRTTPQGKQEIRIPLGKILSNKAPDPELKPEDIVFVPSSAVKSATRRGLEAILQAATGVVIYRR